MTPGKYRKQLSNLDEKHKARVASLKTEYALAHNIVKIGDIVRDSMGFVKVEEIKAGHVSYFAPLNQLPTCVYFGPIYTLKRVPSKCGGHRSVYERNIIEIFEEE